MRKRLFSMTILLLLSLHLAAQEYYFKNYQVEDGLSHNTITSSLQDQRGFLWFGTKDGLDRFDGYNFKVFRQETGKANSLGSNFVRTLHEFQNNIWVGTDNGLYKYQEELEEFQLIPLSANEPILDIENDDQGNLWFIAAGNVYRMNIQSGKTDSFNRSYAWWLFKDSSGKIWMTTQDQFFSFQDDTNDFQPEEVDLHIHNDLPFIITKVMKAQKDLILIGTKYHGAFWYDTIKKTAEAIFPEDQNPLYVRDFTLASAHELWLATESGVYIYNLNTERFTNLKKSYNNPYSLSDNAIYTLTTDTEGGVWMGTYFGGINYYPKPYTPFNKYFPKVGENSISGNAVREIHQDQYGKIWIGTEDAGLNRFDPVTGEFWNIPQKNLSHYNIHGILPLDDELWVGTFEHGLDILDIQTGRRLRHYESSNTRSLNSDFIIDIFKSSEGTIYLLTSSGIYSYEPLHDDFVPVPGLPENHHYAYIAEDQKGIIWLGTYWDGLYRYNPKKNQVRAFTHKNDDSYSISSNVINGIFSDSAERLWVTTENGLNLYDPKTGNFRKFTTHDGLPSNVTYSILEDQNGILWISTSNGLVKFDVDKEEMKTYTTVNGLISDQFNYSSAFQTPEGQMYFGSVDGMISFNPQNFTENNASSPVLFTDIQINNKKVPVNSPGSPLDKSINFQKEIVLNHRQSSFSLEFTNLSYSSSEMTEYWYKMKGLHDDWVYLGKEHRIFFTELPAGTYELQIRSKNGYGSLSPDTAKLGIEVLPPIWLSKWAYFVYTLLVFTAIYFLIRYYHQYTQEKNQQKFAIFQNQKEKEIYQAKIQFFTNVAHEIRTPLSLIKAPLEKLMRSTEGQKKDFRENLAIMDKNTSRLLNLVNELLDFRKTESQNLKLSFVQTNISSLLQDTVERFKPVIDEKKLSFQLQLPAKPVIAYVDEEGVRKILSNLFNNAVKYSEKMVRVKLEQNEQYLTMSIENDGPKIPETCATKIFEPFFRVSENNAFSGSGIGLSLAHSLTSLHNGKLKLENEHTETNRFILELPLHQHEEFDLYEPAGIDKEYRVAPSPSVFQSTEKSNVLLVEDNQDLLNFLQRELQESYRVFQAEDAQKALEILSEESIQLVLSDVSMPGTDGYSLCKMIKSDLATSHIPVVLLTAKSGMNSKIEGLESGADSYVTKPFSVEYLKAQIHSLIQNRRNVMEFFSSTPLSHIKSIANSRTDADFLTKLDKVIFQHLSDTSLSVETLADIMNMSRSSLYRKISELSNLSPNELINLARLKKAAELLHSGEFKIYEVAEKVGYKSQTSFGRNFQKQFHMTPSEYMNSTKV